MRFAHGAMGGVQGFFSFARPADSAFKSLDYLEYYIDCNPHCLLDLDGPMSKLMGHA